MKILSEWEEHCRQAAKVIATRSYPRKRLVEILRGYQARIGNESAPCAEQLRRLEREGTLCVVAGQQVGLLTGPAMTISKAIGCLYVARQLDAVPIFWVATEDHDVEEVAATYLVSPVGNLERYHVELEEGHAVETLLLDAGARVEIERLLERLQLEFPWLKGVERYAELQIRCLEELFRGSGLLFVEPFLLRALAGPFFERALLDAQRLRDCFCASSDQLKREGRAAPLDWREGTTNIFQIAPDGRRTMLRAGEGTHLPLERLSTGAAMRPLLQSFVLPVAAYVAGPTEALYWAQLDGLFEAHGMERPIVVARPSFIFISKLAAELLAELHLDPEQTLPMRWEELQLSELQRRQVPGYALHYLRQFFKPKGKPQERLLNFWGFQGARSAELVAQLLQSRATAPGCHVRVSLSGDLV